jgi:hypothetical protein
MLESCLAHKKKIFHIYYMLIKFKKIFVIKIKLSCPAINVLFVARYICFGMRTMLILNMTAILVIINVFGKILIFFLLLVIL